jgi:negative regulator of sigma E activity
MGILTLAAIAAGILLVVFVIRRVASSNSGAGSRSQFNIENSDPTPLNFNPNILNGAKENKMHQDRIRKNFEQSRKSSEEFQKRSREFQKQAADAAERARKNFEESRKRNENMRKQIEETNKRHRDMRGW